MSAGRYYETSLPELRPAGADGGDQGTIDQDAEGPPEAAKRSRSGPHLSVTLRGQTKADNLVAGFTDFVDDRYYSGSEGSQAA